MKLLQSISVVITFIILNCVLFPAFLFPEKIQGCGNSKPVESACFQKTSIENQHPAEKEFSYDFGEKPSNVMALARPSGNFSFLNPSSAVLFGKFLSLLSFRMKSLAFSPDKEFCLNLTYSFSSPCQYYVFALRKIII